MNLYQDAAVLFSPTTMRSKYSLYYNKSLVQYYYVYAKNMTRVFIMCWLPTFTILLLDSSCRIQFCPILNKAEMFFGFATLNSALNPIIYTLRSKDMRKEFLRVLCCWGVLQSGRPADRCLVPLKSSSSLEHCTNKHEHQTTPIMQDCTTCV
uniref:G-protein coupled receptors family 1 profile domain-containing protein n=1 Tax=Knipowitschia caucasica TaxID=637954 RepID=A0AAV2KJC3_KNICA